MRLGKYKGLHVRQPDLTVQEEEIDNVLKRMQRRNAVIVHIDNGENIRRILENQPIDDDFARDFSDCDTLDELRGVIREELEERRYISSEEKVQRELLAAVIADSDISVDSDTIQDVADTLYDELLDDLYANGITPESYLKRRNMTEVQLLKEQEDEAELALQSEAVLRAIADREKIAVLPDELADELRLMAEEDGEDPASYIDSFDDEELAEIQDEMLLEKAMDFIIEHAVFE